MLRPWLLPVLLVLNGVVSVAIADRAATLRHSWQAWDVRLGASARLRYMQTLEEERFRRRDRVKGAAP